MSFSTKYQKGVEGGVSKTMFQLVRVKNELLKALHLELQVSQSREKQKS